MSSDCPAGICGGAGVWTRSEPPGAPQHPDVHHASRRASVEPTHVMEHPIWATGVKKAALLAPITLEWFPVRAPPLPLFVFLDALHFQPGRPGR